MSENKNQKTIIIMLAVIVLFNTVAISFVYLLLEKRVGEINNLLLISLQNPQSKEDVQALDIDSRQYPYLGSPSAPVEMIIITDFECPFCQKLYKEVFPRIITEYVDKGLLKIGYLPYPLEKSHPNAMAASLATLCANEQDFIWPMFSYLADNAEHLNIEGIYDFANRSNLNMSEFKSCMESSDSVDNIRDTRNDLLELGIKGTPSIVINKKLIVGFNSYSDITSVIDQELNNF